MVVLVPFDHRTGSMRQEMVATSSGVEFCPAEPSDEGILRKILSEGELEWQAEQPVAFEFGPESFVRKSGIKSFFAVSLREEGDSSGAGAKGQPIGVLFVDYKTARKESTKGRPPAFTEWEKESIRRYAALIQQNLSQASRIPHQHTIDRAVWASTREFHRSRI